MKNQKPHGLLESETERGGGSCAVRRSIHHRSAHPPGGAGPPAGLGRKASGLCPQAGARSGAFLPGPKPHSRGQALFPRVPGGVQPQPLPGAGVLCPQPVPCGGGRRSPPHILSRPAAARLHPGGALLAYRPAGPAAGLPLPVDPERERDEALRPRHRLWLPAGVLHLPRGPAPLPGARRAPVPVRPGEGDCCLRRRRGGVPKHPAGGARPVLSSYTAALSHRYTTRTQQRGTVERWSYR